MTHDSAVLLLLLSPPLQKLASRLRYADVVSDILHAELFPDISNADIRPRLAAAIDACTALRATVAYWTVPSSFVHPSLAKRLASPHGFLCVDIHQPTSIDLLGDLHEMGASVHLHLRELGGSTEEPRSTGMPPHLLHAKMLLFDFANGEAELWTGSHNWTRRALAGPNVEASLVVRIKSESATYARARSFLEWVRRQCEPFDPKEADHYVSLQTKRPEELAQRVIELEGNDISRLSDTVVIIFGNDERDLSELGRINGNVYVSVADSTTFEEFMYSARILQSGLLEGANPDAGGLSFAARRHARRLGMRLPVLEPVGAPPVADVKDAHYFVTLKLGALRPHVRAYEPSGLNVWTPAPKDPLCDRTAEDVRAKLFRGSRALMMVPAPIIPEEMRRKLLPEKRSETNRKLVSRKIIR